MTLYLKAEQFKEYNRLSEINDELINDLWSLFV